MKPDKRLANTKVYVNGKSEEIQKKAFELGYQWCSCGKTVEDTTTPFLFFLASGYITKGIDMVAFCKDGFKELSADEILAMEPNRELKHEFKPFDKVLVRDKGEWHACLFSHYTSTAKYPYACIDGYTWEHCIPFEGNERLVGTTDKPKGE